MSSPPEETANSAASPEAARPTGTQASPDRGTVLVGARAFRVFVAVGAALATFLIIGVPTDIIPNPMFGRAVPVRRPPCSLPQFQPG